MVIELEDGQQLDFPDDTPQQVIEETIRRLSQASRTIGEPPPPALQAPTEQPRPEDHGLFPALDPLSKLKVTGAATVDKAITDVLSYGDVGPLPGRTAPRPPFDIPVIPRHAQDIVEFAGLGRAARAIQGFYQGIKKGLQLGPGTTTAPKPPPGTAAAPRVEPGASQAPKTAIAETDPAYNLIAEVREGRLGPKSAEAIADLVREETLSGRFVYNPQKMAMENIADVIELRLGGTTEGRELSSFYRQVVSDNAKVLQKHAALVKDLDLSRLRNAPLADSAFAQVWKRTTNFIKASLIGQTTTMVRNNVVSGGRLGLDTIQAPLDTSIQTIFKLPDRSRDLDGFMEIVRVLQNISPTQRARVDQFMRSYPTQNSHIFGSYSSDILTKAGIPRGLPEKYSDFVNTAHRWSEFTTRAGVLQARLEQRLRFKGRSLEQLMAENRPGAMAVEDINYAGDQALELTFAKPPEWGGFGQKFVDVVNAPGSPLQPIFWFPRFMINSTKFLLEYNPTGILRYLSARERAALASGETKGVSRALMGGMLLGSAIQLRNSDLAGPRWMDLRLPFDIKGVGKEGEMVDIRPFNPLAAYVFAAEVLKRKKEGTLRQMDGKDITAGVLSVNMRTGVGGYVLDGIFRNFGGDPQKAYENLMQVAGETTAGLLNPIGQFVDIYDDFTTNEQIQRDIRDQPFLGPLKKKIPGLQGDLPDYISPTHRGQTKISQPAARQFTGFRKVPDKNAAEIELDRLGFPGNEIYKGNPDLKIDRIRRTFSSALFEDIIVPFVQTEQYRTGFLQPARDMAAQEARRQGIPPDKQTAFVDELSVRLTNHLKSLAVSKQLEAVHAGVAELTAAVLAPEDHAVRTIQKLHPDLKRLLREFDITPSTIRQRGNR